MSSDIPDIMWHFVTSCDIVWHRCGCHIKKSRLWHLELNDYIYMYLHIGFITRKKLRKKLAKTGSIWFELVQTGPKRFKKWSKMIRKPTKTVQSSLNWSELVWTVPNWIKLAQTGFENILLIARALEDHVIVSRVLRFVTWLIWFIGYYPIYIFTVLPRDVISPVTSLIMTSLFPLFLSLLCFYSLKCFCQVTCHFCHNSI